MRDIRRRYQNSESNKVISPKKAERNIISNLKSREVSKETEMFEKDNYAEIEYDRSGKPVMKASKHFGLKKKQRDLEDDEDHSDLLKRQAFFDSKRREFDENDIRNFQKKRGHKKKIKDFLFYSILILIITGIILWSTIFSSATITLNPKYKDVEVSDTFLFFKDDVILSNASSSLSKNVMKSTPKELNQKATGTIHIYNNFSESSQILIKNTRFQTAEGKVFRINDSITIPGKKGNTPGSIEVKVSADSYGADYNIPASDFKIPGFKGSQKYNLFYGKSTSSMNGGISGVVSTVSVDDIALANRDLKPTLDNMLKSEVKNFKYNDYFSLYDNLVINYSDNQSLLMTTEQNSYTLVASGVLVSIKKDILVKMISQQVLKDNFNQDETLRIDDISNLTFTFDPDMDLELTSILKVLITGKVRIIWEHNDAAIKKSLIGKKVSTIGEIIKNYNSSIVTSSYTVSPFWLRSFPSNENKIKIEEKLK
ncbi:MAG: hypothetical protein KBD12_01620 [Candidatus Pacebacteria bacterium]|nr:hypothetical protein [Candidatus Paceibacterota bacterium]